MRTRERDGLLVMAEEIHMHLTGAGDAYAEWGELGGLEGMASDIEIIQRRLEAWTVLDVPWAHYDEAVRNLLRCVVVQYGVVPRGAR